MLAAQTGRTCEGTHAAHPALSKVLCSIHRIIYPLSISFLGRGENVILSIIGSTKSVSC